MALVVAIKIPFLCRPTTTTTLKLLQTCLLLIKHQQSFIIIISPFMLANATNAVKLFCCDSHSGLCVLNFNAVVLGLPSHGTFH